MEKIIKKHFIKMFNKLNEFDSGMVDQITGNPMKDYILAKERVIDNTVKELADDIKAEYKLVASAYTVEDLKQFKYDLYFATELYFQKAKGKKIAIYIKEINDSKRK